MTLLAGQFDAWMFVLDPEWALAVLLFGAWYLWAAHVMSAPPWRRGAGTPPWRTRSRPGGWMLAPPPMF